MCVEDNAGNWLIFPPQQKYKRVSTENIPLGVETYEFKGNIFSKVEGETSFQRFGTHYVDNNGNEVYYKIGNNVQLQPKKIKIDTETTLPNE